MSVETWKLVCEIGGLIVVGLTLIFAGGAWITSNILNKRQDVLLRKFAKDLTGAQTELAEANKRAADADIKRLELERQIAPRDVWSDFLMEEDLQLFAGTSAFIMYAPGDMETERLARGIAGHIATNKQVTAENPVGGGWTVLGVKPFTPELMAPAPPVMFEGVRMLTAFDVKDSRPPWEYPTLKAAKVLSCQLMEMSVDSVVEQPTAGESWPAAVPRDAILIKVGLKPRPLWSNNLRKSGFSALRTRMAARRDLSAETRSRVEEAIKISEDYDRERSSRESESAEKLRDECRHIVEEQRRLAQKRD